MDHKNVLDFYKEMNRHNIIVNFQGAFSHDLLVVLGDLIKTSDFVDSLSNSKFIKKVFSVFVELSQNIARYSEERVYFKGNEESVGCGIILVSYKENSFHILSGNKVKNEQRDKIVKHCEKINNLNVDEKKSFYKETLKSPRPEGSKGAGVGLIDIARKSKSYVETNYESIDENNSFLIISVKMEEKDGKL